MRSIKLVLLAGTALATPAFPALAQTALPAPTAGRAAPATASFQQAPADEATTVEAVTVTARTTDVRTSIDSISYSLADDLQASTGSLADALRTVPSVDVDPQGNVSLRGDGNVTILVDGRPSGVLSGEGRAQALEQIQADRYARIEVMTNPSAAYSPEGSGGVINLITKPNQPRTGAVATGSISANVGDSERWNLGLSGSRIEGRLTLSGDLSVRHDTAVQDIDRDRERLDPLSGQFLPSRQSQDVTLDSDGVFGSLGLEYRLTDKTQLVFEARGAGFTNEGSGIETLVGRTGTDPAVLGYAREADVRQTLRAGGVTARLLHQFDDAGHEWTNEIGFDQGENRLDQFAVTRPDGPMGAPAYEQISNASPFSVLDLTSAYVRPLGDGGKLRLGYELQIRRPEQDNRLSRGATTAVAMVPGLTNRFEAEQTVHALYATWERPLTEKLSAQFGLRLEQANVEINQVSAGLKTSQDYFRAYPTMHLQYRLSETQTLRASYSRRIQRAQPFQLNSFVAYVDPLNRRSGNPNLQPQQTDSFEAMWQLRAGQTFYQATAYYRDTTRAFTDVASDLGGGVLLTRLENIGARRDAGVEVVANGRLTPTLRYNAAVNMFRQVLNTSGSTGAGSRSATQVSGRLSLNWQPTTRDFAQISGQWNGETLLAQGRRESGGMINLGYRRKLTETVALQMTVRDLLNQSGDVTTYYTPTLRDRTERRFAGRAAYIGLTWTLGTAPARPQDPQFDFTDAPRGGG